MTTAFELGDRVVLHSLSGRDDLNDATGTIQALPPPRGGARYAVRLDDGRGDFKVRHANLKHAASRLPADPGPSIDTRELVADATLFVTDGQFVQPRAAVAPHAMEAEQFSHQADGSFVYKLPLPAGSWEVTLVESDAAARQFTVHCKAVVKSALQPHEQAWPELKGLAISRTVLAHDTADVSSTDVATAVDLSSSALVVHIPATRTVGPCEDAKEAVSDAIDRDVDEEDKENGDEINTDVASDDARTDEAWAQALDKHERSARFPARRPLSAGPSIKRSRRHAQALRRVRSAMCDHRRSAHVLERAEPAWKAERSMHAATMTA